MMSQDNRLLPLPAGDRALERPLSDVAQPKSYGASVIEPTNLREYLFVVLKRKWLILSLMLVVTSLVTIQMFRQPSIYEAKTEIQIDQKTKSVLETKEIVINAQSDPTYWATQLKLLENPALARQVVLTLDLQNNPAFFGGQSQTSLFDSLRRLFSRGKKPTPPPVANGALPVVTESELNEQQLTPEEMAHLEPYEDTVAANLTVEPEVGTSLVLLKYKHPEPELAKKIVNTMADVFVKNNLDRETKGSTNAADLLAKQIADLQLRIQREQEERLNYAKNHNLPTDINNSPDANLEAKRLATYSSQLLEAENVRKEAQARYQAAASATDPNSIPEVRDDQRIQKLRETLDRLEQKRAELLVIYTPEWPDVKKVDEQIKPIKDALDKAPREIVASLKSKYEATVSRENSLREAYSHQTGVTSAQSAAQIELSVLMQKLETDQQSYNMLLQRERELQITKNDRPNNVRVTDYGKIPREPSGPPRLRNIAIAFLLSLLAGIGLAFLLDYLDDTLKTVDDVDRYIHLPALALIPATRNSAERLRLKGRGVSDGGQETTALALIDDARSPIAESYRHLRTSLLLSSAGQPPKSILVTSSQPSEGKTTTAVNTAVMLAQTGAEVVIIDCDLRRPRLHAHFGISNARGVTNYLSGESSIDDLLQPYDKLPNLKLLPSGPVPPNPAELLGSDEMRKLLAHLGERGRFAHIVIDSPPAISFTDASILSTLVDGVMLVVHGGRSSRAVVRRAKQQLMDVGAHIFGVVLNNVKLESQDYYYYAGYYSSYYSDAEDDGAPDPGAGASAGAGRQS
ncbi:MAG: polysaccharide biosynthesis transport protein [Blastocatellia bacterium]|jgi:capsular exopolysaccharide synthesis family protein|nr:polysaccharide biosynthesis transport protein [Blastocatellia bacterium]